MKTTLASLFLFCSTAFAAAPFVDEAALRNYARRSLARCPDAALALKAIPNAGPANFLVFEVNLDSSDENCKARRHMLYSPVSQQVLIGTVILLPLDNRPLNTRVAEQATQLLKRQVTAMTSSFPLPDGLKSTSILKETPQGTFSYHAYVDASERFLIVGGRGNLRTDPARTLRESLGIERAVRRGNPKAKTEIIEISDFQCPTCARAHKKLEPLIKKHLSKIHYMRLDLPLFEHHEWALQAALAAVAIQRVAPAQYWNWVDFVFTNQETIGKQPFDRVIQNFCEDRDINWKAVEKIYRSKTEATAMLDQVSRIFDTGINATPTFIINGQITGFGPEGTFAYEAIRKAIGAK